MAGALRLREPLNGQQIKDFLSNMVLLNPKLIMCLNVKPPCFEPINIGCEDGGDIDPGAKPKHDETDRAVTFGCLIHLRVLLSFQPPAFQMFTKTKPMTVLCLSDELLV